MSNRRDFLKLSISLLPFAAYGGLLVIDKHSVIGRSSQYGHKYFLLPPGALETVAFMSRCIRCHRCGEACPNSTISFLDTPQHPSVNGLPVIRPREKGCITCMKCGQACPTGAIRSAPDSSGETVQEYARMGTAEIDTNICFSYNSYACGVCTRACPFEGVAITAGVWERPQVNTDKCVGCGLCEQACIHYPQAIRVRPNPDRVIVI